tara:strand:- start:4582 stop:5157 length:576 start_codon:yes stop_codon:yes gene_type:complete
MSETKETTFDMLSKIPVKHLVSKKNGLDYVSWADAWSLLKRNCPDATRKVYESDVTGLNYFTDGRTAYVKVGITVGGEEIIDMLPVFDFRMKAIPVDKITSMDVNKAIQRSTAKAIAMHGLGVALYSGEDIPQEVKAPKVKPSLELNTPAFAKVLKYVQANSHEGADALVSKLKTKFTISQVVADTIKASV